MSVHINRKNATLSFSIHLFYSISVILGSQPSPFNNTYNTLKSTFPNIENIGTSHKVWTNKIIIKEYKRNLNIIILLYHIILWIGQHNPIN